MLHGICESLKKLQYNLNSKLRCSNLENLEIFGKTKEIRNLKFQIKQDEVIQYLKNNHSHFSQETRVNCKYYYWNVYELNNILSTLLNCMYILNYICFFVVFNNSLYTMNIHGIVITIADVKFLYYYLENLFLKECFFTTF